MPHGLWEDEFYMTQSILLVIIVIGTIALITCRSGVGILLGEVNIYDKEDDRVLSRCCYYFNSLATLCW